MVSPKFDLKHVRELATQPNIEHWFAANKAVNHVVEMFGKTNVEAEKFILDQLCELRDCHFSHTVLMGKDPYDVYGMRIESIPWYIKFSILTDEKGEYICNISFHLTKKELKTRSEVLEKY